MSKKQFFLIVDTETTIKDTVADFGAIVVDRNGVIQKECAVLVQGHYGTHELFHDANSKDEIWTKKGLERRAGNYATMLEQGSRMVASVAAINRWLERVNTQYSPELTAFNLAFDTVKCANTGIDLSMFAKRFCLWHLACGHFASTKAFKNFVVANHLFNAPTAKGNMTYKTNAEVMASFVAGEMLPPEPHTAIEDAKFYELPILAAIVKKNKWREKVTPYNWNAYQVKDHFAAA